MLGTGWLNFFSILLGLASWALPVVSLLKRGGGKGGMLLCAVSLAACSGSLYFQLLSLGRRVKLQDWAGLSDTLPVTVSAAAALLAVTFVLNAIALIVHLVRKPKEKQQQES